MKKDVAKRVKVQPVFEGTILSKARKIIDRRGVVPVYKGKPVIAIDADGEEYNFQSCAEVERTTLISAGRIQSAIHDYKLGKREIPLVEGFCWLYVADKVLVATWLLGEVAINCGAKKAIVEITPDNCCRLSFVASKGKSLKL